MRWDELKVERRRAASCPATASRRPSARSTRPRRSTPASTRCGRSRCSTGCRSSRGCRSGGRSTRTGDAPMPVSTASPAPPTPTSTSTPAATSRRRSWSRSTRPRCCGRELTRPSWRREHVAMGTNTDPYQWVEGRYRLMPGIWEALRGRAARRRRCSPSRRCCCATSTLMKQVPGDPAPTCPCPRSRRRPGARPSRTPRTRASGSRRWPSSTGPGIPCGILIAPLMPGVNDSPEQVERIIELADGGGRGEHRRHRPAPARRGQGICGSTGCAEHRPDLLPRYERLYARGAYAPQAGARAAGARWPGVAARGRRGRAAARGGGRAAAGGRRERRSRPRRQSLF